VALVAEARARGVDVTCETCPHYLVLTEDDLERLGAVAKCAPPLRPAGVQHALWEKLLAGDVDLIASDHSPSPESMKQAANFFEVWGGIAGCQTLLGLLLEEGHARRGMAVEVIARLTSTAAAARFQLGDRGRLEPGCVADLAVVDLGHSAPLAVGDLRDRHRLSPYLGRTLRGRVRWTLVRGRVVARESAPVGLPIGQLVRPQRSAGAAREAAR
jgi:allantoinase